MVGNVGNHQGLLTKSDDAENQAQATQKLSEQLAGLNQANATIAASLQEMQQHLSTLTSASGSDVDIKLTEMRERIQAQLQNSFTQADARIEAAMAQIVVAVEKNSSATGAASDRSLARTVVTADHR